MLSDGQTRKRETVCRRVYQTRRPSYFFRGRESVKRPCLISEKIRGRAETHTKAARSMGGRRRRHTDHPHADHTRMTRTPTSAVWKCGRVWVLPSLHHPRFSSLFLRKSYVKFLS